MLEGLYTVSLDALNAYNTRGKAKLNRGIYTKTSTGISYPLCYLQLFHIVEMDTHCQMIQGNFLKLRTKDWRDADIVFANSTCYDEVLMAGIGTEHYVFLFTSLHFCIVWVSSDSVSDMMVVVIVVVAVEVVVVVVVVIVVDVVLVVAMVVVVVVVVMVVVVVVVVVILVIVVVVVVLLWFL